MFLRAQRGVTLIEMVVVVSLLGLMVGITFPAVSSGIDSYRIATATDSIAGFLNSALSRANRRQEVVEIEITLSSNTMRMRSSGPGNDRVLEMPGGVTIKNVLPPIPVDRDVPRYFLIYPGGTVPQLGIEITNRRGSWRIVRVDPITGVPQIERGVRK